MELASFIDQLAGAWASAEHTLSDNASLIPGGLLRCHVTLCPPLMLNTSVHCVPEDLEQPLMVTWSASADHRWRKRRAGRGGGEVKCRHRPQRGGGAGV